MGAEVNDSPNAKGVASEETTPYRTGHARTNRSRHYNNSRSEHNSYHYDLDAEAALLGVALLTSEAHRVFAETIEVQDFYSPGHAEIAQVIISAYVEKWPVDMVSVASALRAKGILEDVGGTTKLVELVANAPSTSSVAHYCKIVHDLATLRRVVLGAQKVSELSLSSFGDVHDVVEAAQKTFADVAAQNGARTFSSLDVPDMAALVAGDLKDEQPAILSRTDGQTLIYPGRIHVFQAESSSGKSWIALMAAVQLIEMGATVLYLDYEDSARGIVNRLLTLGLRPHQIVEQFQWVKPTGPMGVSEKAQLQALIDKTRPELVILDGVTEAMARDNSDDNQQQPVAQWFQAYPRWITAQGPALLMIDHVSKDKERRGRHAIGSVHKLNAVDGASFTVDVIKPFSRQKPGAVKLVVAKDRHGSVGANGSCVAIVNFNPRSNGEVMDWSIERPAVKAENKEPWKPTRVMEAVSRELETAKSPYTAALLNQVMSGRFRKALVTEALGRLTNEGFLGFYKMGASQFIRLVKPYRDGHTPPELEAVQTVLGGVFLPKKGDDNDE